MNDIMNSAAFREFLQKRCEEILLNDERYAKINQAILNLEDEICAMLSTEAINKFVCLESLVAELFSHIEPLLYLKGITDRPFL